MYSQKWSDISDYIVHFTKDDGSCSAYDNVMSILGNCMIEARNPFGFAKGDAPQQSSQNAVCFSEIPLHELSRLSSRRGKFGFGFLKSFARSKEVNPIWYVEKDSVFHHSLTEIIQEAKNSENPSNHSIWSITPLIDAPGDYGNRTYRFEWEREWRHVGHFSFEEGDVAFLIIPEELHVRAEEFFESVAIDNTGPSYLCPYIDPGWDEERIAKQFRVRSRKFVIGV